jgi:hypothetical protein
MTIHTITHIVGFKYNFNDFLKYINHEIPDYKDDCVEDAGQSQDEQDERMTELFYDTLPHNFDDDIEAYGLTHDLADEDEDDDKRMVIIGIPVLKITLNDYYSDPREDITEIDIKKILKATKKIKTWVKKTGIEYEKIKVYAVFDDCGCCS